MVLAVWVRRYGFPVGARQRFFAGYGATPRGAVFEAMCSLYEIHAVAWAFAFASSEPRLAVEARIRLDGVLGRSSVPWSLS